VPCRELCKGAGERGGGGSAVAQQRARCAGEVPRAAAPRASLAEFAGRINAAGGCGARRASPRGAEQTLPDRLWPSVAHFPARTRAARVPARGLVWPRSAGKPRCSRSASVLEPEGGTRGSSARGRPRSDTRWRCPAAGGARPGHLKARPRPLHPFVATRRVGLYWAHGRARSSGQGC